MSFTVTPQDIASRTAARPITPLGNPQEVQKLEVAAQTELEEQIEAEHEANLLAASPAEYERYLLAQRQEGEDAEIPRDEVEGIVR